jgi:hypothetical protein
MQWPTEKRIYNYLQKTRDGATQIPLNTRGKLSSNECDSIAHNVWPNKTLLHDYNQIVNIHWVLKSYKPPEISANVKINSSQKIKLPSAD